MERRTLTAGQSAATSEPRVGDPLAAYDYHLPAELVAQEPARRRVQARLMVLEHGEVAVRHSRVCQLTRWLRAGDLLVVNDTRVVPARLLAIKDTGGKVEILLLSPASPRRVLPDGREVHDALVGTRRPVHEGQVLLLGGQSDLPVVVMERGQRGRTQVMLPVSALKLASRLGQVPLPPYIKRPEGPSEQDRRRYQTVYASREGAVAAPTAGLHLSRELLAALRRRGVTTASVTLHVGYGTFAEPRLEDLAAGRLHAEWVEVGEEACRAVRQARERGGRVISVGTTSLRALEWASAGGGLEPRSGWCDLLIDEGHHFRAVDGLMTNFHLPRTTLLMLVAALAGRERVLDAYREARERGYRFYSYGDAMLIA